MVLEGEHEVCTRCTEAVKEAIEEARCKVWDELPDIFGLGSWRALGRK